MTFMLSELHSPTSHLTLTIKNLSDKAYRDHASYGETNEVDTQEREKSAEFISTSKLDNSLFNDNIVAYILPLSRLLGYFGIGGAYMSSENKVSVTCGVCSGDYSMTAACFDNLKNGGEVDCDICGFKVGLENSKLSNFTSALMVFYILFGCLAILFVIIGNSSGYFNFSSYYVSIPFIISTYTISAYKKANPTKLTAIKDMAKE